MALPNPWYIDAEARHLAQQQRLLAYSAVEGQEGVLGETQLAVTDLDTPGGAINVAPGGYAIKARHLGGEFESYVGKFVQQETVTVNPTDSSGPRTDLVILRIENPYVTGSGTWAQPADPLNGPYAHVRVIEGVPQGTSKVEQVNPDWSAITLARIYRPANTGIVQQSHITDLRQLAKLGGGRVDEEEPPPGPDPDPDPEPPPIGQAIFMDVRNHKSSDGTSDVLSDDGWWHNWPDAANWNIPIPSWATGADIFLTLSGVRQDGGGVWGKLRVSIDNGAINTPEVVFDFTSDGLIEGWQRFTMTAAGTVAIPSSMRNKMKRFRVQANHDGEEDDGQVRWMHGSCAIMIVVFKQYPIYG